MKYKVKNLVGRDSAEWWEYFHTVEIPGIGDVSVGDEVVTNKGYKQKVTSPIKGFVDDACRDFSNTESFGEAYDDYFECNNIHVMFKDVVDVFHMNIAPKEEKREIMFDISKYDFSENRFNSKIGGFHVCCVDNNKRIAFTLKKSEIKNIEEAKLIELLKTSKEMKFNVSPTIEISKSDDTLTVSFIANKSESFYWAKKQL